MNPYYSDDFVTIYHGDCRGVLPLEADVLVTDPPFGIAYNTGQAVLGAASIQGDADTSLRDWVVSLWEGRPAIIFGSWKRPIPIGTRQILIWDTKGALGMGALDLPWKPSHQQIYVLGRGFTGHRGTDVLSVAPVQGTVTNGRVHPNEKPVQLLRQLLGKCPPGTVLDPFMGSGTTLRAAKDLGRKAIGIEIEEKYCEIAARRMCQEVLAL